MKQGSLEWLTFRKTKITATDAADIMCKGFRSMGQLFDEKLGLREPDPMNDAMKRGLELEGEAREAFEKETGLFVFPMVITSPFHDFMAASLDGMTMEKDVAVEIKCPGVKTHMRTLKEGIPKYYIPQLQHQMSVTGLNEIYYFSYCPESETNIPPIKCYRDEVYINNLIEKERQFFELYKEALIYLENHALIIDGFKERLHNTLTEKNE